MTAVHMDADKIFREVETRTGLTGLADDALRTRFRALIEAFNAQHQVTAAKLPGALEQIEMRVEQRLLLERDFQRMDKEISAQKIERPIFVVGYGRTGTTVMHCLLVEDPNSRGPEFWEGLRPSPPPGQNAAADKMRIEAGNRDCQAWLDAIPGMLRAHPYWDEGAHTLIEDEEVFSIDFLVPYATHYYNVPYTPLDYVASDPLVAYRFQKKYFQTMQLHTPPKRWVGKGVFHQFCLDKLWEVYPDAICVWTHRNPAEMFASMLGIYTVLYDPITGGIDRPDQAARMLKGLRQGYDHVLQQPWLTDPRVVHVRFRDFIADQVGTIRNIYERMGLPFSAQHEQNIKTWLANNKADRHGKFTYSLEGYGLTEKQLRETFADYVERFDLA